MKNSASVPLCPACGSNHSRTFKTGHTTCKRIFRIRTCVDCGHRFNTVQPREELIAYVDVKWNQRKVLDAVTLKPMGQNKSHYSVS